MKIKNHLVKFYKSLCKPLTHSPLKQVVYILSHGGAHLILLFVLSISIWRCHEVSTTEIGPEYHEVQISLSNELKWFQIVAEVTSDSIYTNYGYSQAIQIRYGLQKNERHINKLSFPLHPYSTTFNIARYPHQTEWAFSDNIQRLHAGDSIQHERNAYHINELNDSTLSIKVHSKGINGIATSYGWSTFDIYGNELFSPDKEKENPYYYFSLRLDGDYRNYDYSNTNILIKFGDFARNGKDVRMTKPLKYQYIFPEPDMITSGSIMYSSQQKIKEVIDNRGIIVQAEDINVKNKGDREAFINAIILGAMIAFWLDIFVNLVIKWRNLNLKEHKDNI